MNNESTLLLKLISENKSLNEISSILGLSPKQIHIRLTMLRNSGYLFDRNFSYNGDTFFSFHDPLVQPSNTIINVDEDINTIKAILISDTHLGNINDSIECIDAMYNYCTKEGINIILHAGDFFEGIYDSRKKQCKFKNAENQISYGLKNYPYDKNILNFILLGNHDATFITNNGIDIQSVILNKRHDLIPIGYGCSDIILGNYLIKMRHQMQNIKLKNINPNNTIFLYGHSHIFSTNTGGNSLSVHIPSLSYVSTGNIQNPLPSIVEMTLEISGNQICQEKFKQFIFDCNNNPICISNINYCIPMTQTKLAKQKEKIVPSIFDNHKQLIKK